MTEGLSRDELIEQVERLRGEIERQAADELTRMRYHDEEVARLREQVETLQAEREDMTEWYRVRARGGGIYYAKNEKDALKYLLEVGGVLESRLCTPWLPVTKEGPTP